MPFPVRELTLGPVECAWRPHRRGEPAEPHVRDWLARPLALVPDSLPLTRGPRGRPGLGGPLAHMDVNWSHSGEGLLMARARDHQVGVDLERLRARPRALDLARRFFAPAEAAALASLPEQRREREFTTLWCAKEAVLKAHGSGLAFGLHRLVFEPGDAGWRLVRCDGALGPAEAWSLHRFEPASGYVAVVAWRPRPAD